MSVMNLVPMAMPDSAARRLVCAGNLLLTFAGRATAAAAEPRHEQADPDPPRVVVGAQMTRRDPRGHPQLAAQHAPPTAARHALAEITFGSKVRL
jgi:hypothetical protein